MKVIAFNASPRKEWNTATLLHKALDGAASKGAETEFIHLNNYNYKGCSSCFACKQKGGISYGKCALKDDLTPLLKKVEEADVLILGTPIYLGMVNGLMQSFLERLLYPYLVYDAEHSTLFPRKIKTGFIYALGAPEERMRQVGYDRPAQINEMLLKAIFGESESLLVCDTYQFDDYSKYETSGINVEQKSQKRKEVFPQDCQKAFDMGVRLTSDI